MESCNGFADLENQKAPKHVQNPFKIIFRAQETKKNFSIFFLSYLIHGPPSVIDTHSRTTWPYGPIIGGAQLLPHSYRMPKKSDRNNISKG
jgi:hypothetical protein